MGAAIMNCKSSEFFQCDNLQKKTSLHMKAATSIPRMCRESLARSVLKSSRVLSLKQQTKDGTKRKQEFVVFRRLEVDAFKHFI